MIFYFFGYKKMDWYVLLSAMAALSAVSIADQNAVLAVVEDGNKNEKVDMLLIEEISSIKESIDNVANAIDEGNYTSARQQVNDIRNGDSWNNVRKQVQERNDDNLAIEFENSLLTIDELLISSNSNAAEYVNVLSEDFDKIIKSLGKPIIDVQRLILTISIAGVVIFIVLYVTPKFRQKLNIKY